MDPALNQRPLGRFIYLERRRNDAGSRSGEIALNAVHQQMRADRFWWLCQAYLRR